MTDFIPLQSNLTTTPVFHLDRSAPAADLHGGAVQRIKASRDLLHSLNCLSLKGVDERDLNHFVNAAHLLLQDGCDALDALQWRLEA
ncbi:hypothetical protein DNK59_18005 [Pseudomonas sp. TKO26]|uniref:hypothetical protein n=1 Tax=unclassified Pseudomonas TaxID=196821 RepID=UPI000D928377|nr:MULTISPECIES: hypothetical protein [unclassified Pseudomonas]PYY84521.1 hypothetical protein DNK62_18005 [Pseudomonas sp. TKO30]PYY86124.1 hypothetical protein DNK61_18000 [Pseudomonas sp. TKO29]PYY88998.1 hypothetical protein DNK59_18005 [Pseudomonas sp. TKO26]PYY99120.1 hypothetical protein DNK60_17995 [Pseudomonas sp. TKO14]